MPFSNTDRQIGTIRWNRQTNQCNSVKETDRLISTFQFLTNRVPELSQSGVGGLALRNAVCSDPVPTGIGIKVLARVHSSVHGCQQLPGWNEGNLPWTKTTPLPIERLYIYIYTHTKIIRGVYHFMYLVFTCICKMMWVIVCDSCLCCYACVTSFERWLTPFGVIDSSER